MFSSAISDMSSCESEGCEIVEQEEDITHVYYDAWVELSGQFPDIFLKGSLISVTGKKNNAWKQISPDIKKILKLDI